MRIAALLVLLVLPVGLAACGEPAPSLSGSERAAAFTVPESAEVQGRALETVEEGPWVVRRTEASNARGSDGGEAELRVRGGAGAVGGRPGPTTGAPRKSRLIEEVDHEVLEAPGAPAPVAVPTPSPEPMLPLGELPAADPFAEPEATPDESPPLPAELMDARSGAPTSQPQARLKAGSTDDNADFEAFLTFLGTWVDQVGVADRYHHLDVTDRRFLKVLDGAGRPVPGARVHVVDEKADEIVWSGQTYGDGRVPFYPRVVEKNGTVPEGGWLVDVRHGDLGRLERWDGEGPEYVVHLDAAKPVEEPIALDVCILLDTTGSMKDEMGRIKATLVDVTKRLREIGTEFDLRYGAVLYRDLGDAYVTMRHPFTADVEGFATALQGLDAGGGGDEPESLNQGMAEAIGRLDWRPGAAHVMFVIADAPPHMDYEGDVPYGTSLLSGLDQGIRIHSVAASGLNAFGTFVFRQIAQFGRGKFIFIEYGSTAASAASHGVTGTVKSNNLDDILYDQIVDELSAWGH